MSSPSMKWLLLTASLWLTAWTDRGLAAAAAIDDSGTIIRSPVVQMRWQAVAQHRITNTLTGSTTVQVRLNVTPWLRHTGRIYLVLPAQPPGPIRATWTTQGRLLPGQITSGSRTLVYSGPIESPRLQDILQMTLEIGGTGFQETCRLDFRFEMEAM